MLNYFSPTGVYHKWQPFHQSIIVSGFEDFEKSLICQIGKLNKIIITSTRKYANEHFSKVYNTMNGKKVMVHFPNLERILFISHCCSFTTF